MSMTLTMSTAVLLVIAASSKACEICDMLGQDNVQGLKSGFMAGNKVYYVGGHYNCWRKTEDETIGLTHPFYHDLRSRGDAIAHYDSVGTGNDFRGWEFYSDTKVAYGTVIAGGMRWENPVPKSMFWRPDKMIVEYQADEGEDNPFVQVSTSSCTNWTQASGPNATFKNLSEDECWIRCNKSSNCYQAEHHPASNGHAPICKLGLNNMTAFVKVDQQNCTDKPCVKCYSKVKPTVTPVKIREEKYVAENDVISTTIWADRPITIEISGHSYLPKDYVSLNAQCSYHAGLNAIEVKERGTARAAVINKPKEVDLTGPMVYDGMSTIISASRPLENPEFGVLQRGVCNYTFSFPVDSQNTTLSWTMGEDSGKATSAVQQVVSNPSKAMSAKTEKMDHVLTEVVPYFRCSDDDINKVYYFLWSIYLMYYTQGDEGMQVYPHTQTAVNNFLGMHRYDADFQIRVGSWTNPLEHDFYANGNVLAWSTIPAKYWQHDTLPDNFGIDWVSGVYGSQAIGHVIGAWQIYEHSGNRTFLSQAYEFYRKLFAEHIVGFWGSEYDGTKCLIKMAEELGYTNDTAHWESLLNTTNEYVNATFSKQWEVDTKDMYGITTNGIGLGNVAPTMATQFPREWVERIATTWYNDSVKGFNTEVPLARVAIKDWDKAFGTNRNFAITPDGNWFQLAGMYIHNVDGLANQFTLGHLKKYNMERGVPVAPEARRTDFSPHGDQYSNFNAGKIQVILEGIGGLRYSVINDTFTFADNLPMEWSFMEYQVPVLKHGKVSWVKARSERKQSGSTVVKTVTVESNPFESLVVEPWAEDRKVLSSSPGSISNATPGHVSWRFNSTSATVTLTLHA